MKKQAARYMWGIEKQDDYGGQWRFWHFDYTRERALANLRNVTNTPRKQLRLVKFTSRSKP